MSGNIVGNIVGQHGKRRERRVDANKKILELSPNELIAVERRIRTLSQQKNNFSSRGLADDTTRKDLR
jgi:hypothetical protein